MSALRSGTTAASVKIGYVSPKSGSLAPFAEADDFILGAIRQQFDKGLTTSCCSRRSQIWDPCT